MEPLCHSGVRLPCHSAGPMHYDCMSCLPLPGCLWYSQHGVRIWNKEQVRSDCSRTSAQMQQHLQIQEWPLPTCPLPTCPLHTFFLPTRPHPVLSYRRCRGPLPQPAQIPSLLASQPPILPPSPPLALARTTTTLSSFVALPPSGQPPPTSLGPGRRVAPCPPIVMAGRLWASAQGGESVEGRPCGAGHAVLAWGAEDPLRAGPLEMHGLTWEPTVV